MYYLATGFDTQKRFRNAVLLAMAVHAVLILAINFNAHTAAKSTRAQIEVTLATRPSATAPEDAHSIAQANQEGSGNDAERNQISTANPLQTNTLEAQQPGSQIQQEQSALQRDTLTTSGMAQRQAATQPKEQVSQEASVDGISPEGIQFNRELASVQAELNDETRTNVAQPRVRRLTAASAKQGVDAAYLLDWRRRLEAVGNQYYPQASVRYGIYGDLRMLVVIRSDGSLEDIQILSSSGYAVLDEAAIKIVRMAAPYSPFPPELQATTDKLEIVRTWHFQENPLSSP
jgi:protein TonB